jgi:hypothetical protein
LDCLRNVTTPPLHEVLTRIFGLRNVAVTELRIFGLSKVTILGDLRIFGLRNVAVIRYLRIFGFRKVTVTRLRIFRLRKVE